MAYVNVAEWNPEHVADWLRGKYFSVILILFMAVYLLGIMWFTDCQHCNMTSGCFD